MMKYVVAVGLIIGGARLAYAEMSDAKNVQAVYAGATIACTACHPEGKFKELNAYGKDYNDRGRSVDAVTATDEKDSDGDGVTNIAEIKAGTNPGDPESK